MPEMGHSSWSGPEVGQGRHSLPHGEQVAPHSHRRGHIVYPATGVLSITTAAGTWIAPATRLAWTPGGFEHHHRAYGDADMRISFVSADLAARLPDRPAVFTASALVRELLLAATDDVEAPRSPDARTRLLALAIDEIVLAGEQPLHLPEPRDDRLRSLAARLREDPSDNATLAELGTRVGASRRTLTRLFEGELGMSFRQWRTQMRLHHALTLLAAGQTVTSTAAACGWANPTSFIEAFSAVFGETPARYRAIRPTRWASEQTRIRQRRDDVSDISREGRPTRSA